MCVVWESLLRCYWCGSALWQLKYAFLGRGLYCWQCEQLTAHPDRVSDAVRAGEQLGGGGVPCERCSRSAMALYLQGCESHGAGRQLST